MQRSKGQVALAISTARDRDTPVVHHGSQLRILLLQLLYLLHYHIEVGACWIVRLSHTCLGKFRLLTVLIAKGPTRIDGPPIRILQLMVDLDHILRIVATFEAPLRLWNGIFGLNLDLLVITLL